MTIALKQNCTDAELPAVSDAERPDVFNLFFREFHHMPKGWRMVRLSRNPDDVPEGHGHVEGGLWTDVWKKRDKSADKKFFFKFSDLHDFEAKLAARLGVCPKCWGAGRTVRMVSLDKSQNRWDQCVACEGKGK